jgi:hypothetical protein
MPLTELQKRFAETYAIHGVEWGPKKCAAFAGQKQSPSSWAHTQLEKPSVRKLIGEKRAEIIEEAQRLKDDAGKVVNAELLPPVERLRLSMDIHLLDGASLIALRSNLAQASMADWTEVVYERDAEGHILEKDGKPVCRVVIKPEKGFLMGHGHHVKRLKETKWGWDLTLIDSTQERNALGRYLGIDSKDDKYGNRQGTDAAERRARVAAALAKLSPEQRREFYTALLREGRHDEQLPAPPA